MLFSGMALGFADETAPVNQWRTRRDPFEAWGEMRGFERRRRPPHEVGEAYSTAATPAPPSSSPQASVAAGHGQGGDRRALLGLERDDPVARSGRRPRPGRRRGRRPAPVPAGVGGDPRDQRRLVEADLGGLLAHRPVGARRTARPPRPGAPDGGQQQALGRGRPGCAPWPDSRPCAGPWRRTAASRAAAFSCIDDIRNRPSGLKAHGDVAAGPVQQHRLLLGDAGVPERRPAIGGRRQPPALGVEGDVGHRALVGEGALETGSATSRTCSLAAGAEGDQAGAGARPRPPRSSGP